MKVSAARAENTIAFSLAAWAAWAPGIEERADWDAWARSPWLPSGDQVPALEEVPAMQRRRIERLGRMAMQAAFWCDHARSESVPVVFVSRHGDVQRSLSLLEQQARGEPLSPAGFGLSVHNAVAALHSIAQGYRDNYLALAASKAGVEAALIEAAGLLADGANEVQVVVYETCLPPAYAPFLDEPDPPHAWSCRVRVVDAGAGITIGWRADEMRERGASGALPASLEALRFLLSDDPGHEHIADGLRWEWRRHG